MDYCSDMNNDTHMHRMIKKANMKKLFYLKNFLIGLILAVIVCIIVMIFKDKFLNLAENMYNLSAYDCRRLYVAMMWIWKLFIIQFALVPFISMSMIEGHLKKEE